MQTKHLREKKYQIIAAFIMLFLGLLLICRAFYGMDITDETFYVAAAKRFYDGDMLFKDDWNRGQLFGLIMLPLYRVYVFFYGSNEGIILFLRILFVFLELFVSGFLFRILFRNQKSFGAALLSALCILVYARGNIITISYYSLGFYTFLLAVLWWMEAEVSKRGKVSLILSGFSFAISVICMPYMILCFLAMLGVGAYWKTKENAKGWQQFCLWLVGIVLAAICFLICFWKVIPWAQLLEYLPIVFQDPGLEDAGVFEQFWDLFVYIGTVFLKYTWPLYVVTLFFTVGTGKNWIKNAMVRKWLPWILLVEFLIQSVYVRSYFEGGIITTLLLMAVQMQLLYPQYRLKYLEKCFVVPGIVFGVAWVMGSNVGERVINMSFILMDLWAVSFLWYLWQRNSRNVRILMHVPVYLMFAVLFTIRFFDIYRDGSLSQLNYRVSSGIMKGLYTEEHRGNAYEQMVELLQAETTEENVIAVLGCNPWVYTETSASCGAYTIWEFSDGETMLEQYYEKLPERVPDVIVIVPKELDMYESWKYSSHGSGMQGGEQPVLGGTLGRIVETGNYTCVEKSGAVLYKQ